MAAQLGEVIHGPFATATEVIVEPNTVDQSATIAAWFIDAPGQSPAWSKYLLAAIHLRPIDGQSKSPTIRLEGATHEILLTALNPDKNPRLDDTETWHHLTPLNLEEQFIVGSDAAARELVRDCAHAVVAGLLWAEPALSGQVEPWRTVIRETASHYRGEHG